MGVTQQILAALGGGGGGGGGGHRYWRISDFTGTTVSFFETTELGLMEGATDRAAGVTPTASSAPNSGTLAQLTDGGALNVNQVNWSTAVANTLELTFDLTTNRAITGLRLSRFDTAGRFPTAFTVEWSDNGSAWTLVGTYAISEPGSNFTLSSTVTFP